MLLYYSITAVVNATLYTFAVIYQDYRWSAAWNAAVFLLSAGMAYKYWCKLRGKR